MERPEPLFRLFEVGGGDIKNHPATLGQFHGSKLGVVRVSTRGRNQPLSWRVHTRYRHPWLGRDHFEVKITNVSGSRALSNRHAIIASRVFNQVVGLAPLLRPAD